MWWTRWPDANIGIPTGAESGILALDQDGDWGAGSLDALIEEHGGDFSETTTVKTGRGGIHYLFKYPAGEETRNSAGKLGLGLDVRGEGGYIVAPPSRTEGPYEWLERLPLAEPPAWLTEALGEPRKPADGGSGAAAADASLDGGPIPEGRRNDTLARIAGWLRARGHDQAAISKALLFVNRTRCEPPLPEAEVEGIARSISRYPAGSASPGPDAETLAELDAIEAELWRRESSGMAGKSERDIFVALIKLARRHGQEHPEGVRVSVSYRALTLAAAVSKPTGIKAIRRLKDAGLIGKDDAGRKSKECGAFVLKTPPRATFDRTQPPTGRPERAPRVEECGKDLRAPFSAPRLRWSGPHPDDPETVVRRLGKTCGAVMDALERAGGSLSLEELYGCLYPDKDPADRRRWRPRDLKRRIIARLEASAVVEVAGDTVTLAGDWLEALNRERETSGEIAATRRDMARYARERDAYRNRHRTRPDRALSRRDMDARRRERERRNADGAVSELERAPEAPEPSDLYPLVDQRVQTARGPGRLFQVFSGEARVVLDANPERWVPLDLAEVLGAA